MSDQMTPELYWLVLTTILTGVLWMPYISQILLSLGPLRATSEVGGVDPQCDWGRRAKKAHANAVENLAVFAPLVLIIHALGAGDGLTASAAATFFFARAAHYIIYVMGLPYLRTVAFLVGFACQAVLALRLLGCV